MILHRWTLPTAPAHWTRRPAASASKLNMALHQSHVSRPLGKQKSTTSHPMVADEPAKRRQPPSCLEVGTQQTQLTNDGRCRPAATGTDKAVIPPSTPRRPSLIRSPSKQKGLSSRRMSIDKRDGDTIPWMV